MDRSIKVVALLLVGGLQALYLPFLHSEESVRMQTGVWRVPPSFISVADPSSKTGKRKPLPSFQSKQNPNAVQYDATESLKAQGVTFPSGSSAIFDQNSGSLVMYNTPENLEIVDGGLAGCCLGMGSNVVIDISTYECTFPAGENLLAQKWPTYDELTKLPAAALKLLDRASVATKTGTQVSLRQTYFSAVPHKSTENAENTDGFLEGEYGSIIKVEPVVGPDGVAIDASVEYCFRRQGKESSASEISFITNFNGWDDYPVVLYRVPSLDQPGKCTVVTGKVQLVNQGGWGQKALQPSGEAEAPSN